MNLNGKIALVTGAGRGIGRGCAIELARCGASLVLNDRPGSPDLPAAVQQIRALGRPCLLAEADAFCRSGCETLVQAALATFGRLDILVSNPAYNRRCDFLDLPPEDFERIIAGTLTAGFHISQLVARQMVQQGTGGKIVFISSIHALMPYARSAAYNAAKAGLDQLAQSIAVELCPHRINVNAIEPGWIDTPNERATFGDEQIQQAGAKLPWGRLGQPADIGRVAAFLCSADADYITGAVLRVDGGFWFKDCRPEGLMARARS
jgi:glucose 1-dehydrogenase